MSMRARSGSTGELRQTLETLADKVEPQDGCVGFTFYVHEEDRGVLIVQRWIDQTAADAYRSSREHRALLGAIETLCEHGTLSVDPLT